MLEAESQSFLLANDDIDLWRFHILLRTKVAKDKNGMQSSTLWSHMAFIVLQSQVPLTNFSQGVQTMTSVKTTDFYHLKYDFKWNS